MLYNETNSKHNCPQCGDLLKIHFKYSKLIKCQSCGSSIFLEDDAVKLIGERSTLSPEPSLIELHKMFKYQDKTFIPLGKVRYSYGRGFWEEWFLKDTKNKEFWLSVDEGDFVLQTKIKLSLPLRSSTKFTVGSKYHNYLVTEKGSGTCVGFEGELPQKILIDEVHEYVHLSEGRGNLITFEFTNNTHETFKGKWIDPLEIKVLNS